MTLADLLQRLHEISKSAEYDLPHVRHAMGPACGKHFPDICSACWADAHYASLENSFRELRALVVEGFKLPSGYTITFKPTADADKLRGAPDLKGCAWPGPEVDS